MLTHTHTHTHTHTLTHRVIFFELELEYFMTLYSVNILTTYICFLSAFQVWRVEYIFTV